MIDENAFGLLVAHYDLEAIEYDLEPAPFLEHLARFSLLVEDKVKGDVLASSLRQLELGHASYFEFADGDQVANPIVWARELRAKLIEADIPNICVLTAGGRWVTEAKDVAQQAVCIKNAFGPSEPLRKALAAEAHAQPTHFDDSEPSGWGPGLYIEKEAIEQAHKSLKNAPTALPVLSSVFYRIGG